MLVQGVDLGGDLEAVILAILGVVGEHEAEFEVLLVGKALSGEDDAAVQLANTLIHLGVHVEELELHGVALRVVDSGGGDDVVDLHVSGLSVDLNEVLRGARVVLDELGEGEFGELSDHSVCVC